MEKSLSSLNFLMQFGFHAVPQILVYSPAGRDKLRGSEKLTALQDYLKNLLANVSPLHERRFHNIQRICFQTSNRERESVCGCVTATTAKSVHL